jgi:SAM-dependent methyltransferase
VSERGDIPARERAFWDEHVPNLEECLRELDARPDPNTEAMFDAVEPLRGLRALDFACGAGITTARLAQRGAIVTGIDISSVSIERGRELAEHAGLSIEFIVGELTRATFPPRSFDVVVGHWALHHVDLAKIAPILGDILVPGGRCAFVETMGLNPLLNFSRRRVAGHAGVAVYGSDDERPLDRAALDLLAANIGSLDLVVRDMQFLRIFDRNVLRYRRPTVSRVLGAVDDWLLRIGLGILSYHQVVTLIRTRSTDDRTTSPTF